MREKYWYIVNERQFPLNAFMENRLDNQLDFDNYNCMFFSKKSDAIKELKRIQNKCLRSEQAEKLTVSSDIKW